MAHKFLVYETFYKYNRCVKSSIHDGGCRISEVLNQSPFGGLFTGISGLTMDKLSYYVISMFLLSFFLSNVNMYSKEHERDILKLAWFKNSHMANN